mmetsp:Transcript_21760/g.23356  ORF Transcript_21760/g.23356 Transcript_21760/m.23356 type:complete len:493 (+) Transcript_21760:46-1524(+)
MKQIRYRSRRRKRSTKLSGYKHYSFLLRALLFTSIAIAFTVTIYQHSSFILGNRNNEYTDFEINKVSLLRHDDNDTNNNINNNNNNNNNIIRNKTTKNKNRHDKEEDNASPVAPAERPTKHDGQVKVTVPQEQSEHQESSLSNDDKENRSASFCSSSEGSLHQIALDMFHHSSPPGSLSLMKLKEVLQSNSHFYITFPDAIFTNNQENIASMLEGYGLTRLDERPPKEWTNVTLVEVAIFTKGGVCPLVEAGCLNRSRIIIQSEQYFTDSVPRWIEQYFTDLVPRCHESPNCIVLEFSDRNYRNAQAKGMGNSFVLLPVMTQSPSRFAWLLPDDIKPLRERLYDVVFFMGVPTRRRQVYGNATNYLENHPNRTVKIGKEMNVRRQAAAYGEAKVCLVVHSYHDDSGGEYHRLSEFAQFGCIPVMETFGDTIGIDRYKECGRIVFASGPNLMEAAANVTAKIEQGWYKDFHSHVDWWKAGIQWETLLSSVLSE